jgi:hypothetical protein
MQRVSPLDLDPDLPGPGSVKLAEKDPLPGSEAELSLLDKDWNRIADGRGLDVRIGVVLLMLEASLAGDEAAEVGDNIPGNRRVVRFLDEDGSSGVGDIDVTDPLRSRPDGYGRRR